jgi:hypothetical protein
MPLLDPRPASSLCLTCRTTLGAGERCDVSPAHVVVSLREAGGWRRAIETAWRDVPPASLPAPRPKHLLPLAVWWIALVCALWSPLREIALMLAPAALVVWLWTHLCYGRVLRRARPVGATRRAPLRSAGLLGTVVSARTDEPCASALVLALGLEEGDGLTLQHAWGTGFVVAVDDGRRVRVPAGRLRVEAPLSVRRALSRTAVERRLTAMDLASLHRAGPGLHPFPFSDAHAVEIRSGDRVEVLGTTSPEPSRGQGVYRVAAGRELVAVGVPVVRVLRASARSSRRQARRQESAPVDEVCRAGRHAATCSVWPTPGTTPRAVVARILRVDLWDGFCE